jgi:hypothetical protein
MHYTAIEPLCHYETFAGSGAPNSKDIFCYRFKNSERQINVVEITDIFTDNTHQHYT